VLSRFGNFFFRYRDFLFPFACLLIFLPGAPLFADPMHALLYGYLIAGIGQLVRGATIGLKYIIRGGKNRRVYAADLVTEGLYSHSRNPMYVGNVLVLTGIAIASNSWTCVGIAVSLFLFIYVSIIAAEEHFLRDKFGAEFDAYCHDVPRWLPRLRGLGATLSSMEFRWRRVVVKEYGTPCGWIAGLAAIGLYNLWRDGRLHAGEPAVSALALVIVTASVLWATARFLKKSRVLVAD